MRRTTIIGGATLAFALLAALIVGNAWAQGSGIQTLQLTPSAAPG